MSQSAPALSVVLPADELESIRETVRCLCRQTVRGALELVVVTPAAAGLELPEELRDRLGAVSVVEVGEEGFAKLARARAAGARAARAPVVVFGETHSFPEPDWAEALLEAHRGPWAAVGPAMLNANPETAISRANLFVDFGPWVELAEPGTMPDLPGHNSAYKREVLLAVPRLDELMESDTMLHAALREQGHRLYAEPAARTRHLNLAGPFWFVERFDHDRLWALARCRGWSLLRRALYTAGAPLIPAVRLARVHREVRRAGYGRDLRLLAALVAGLLAGAAGELVGYAARRPGRSAARMREVELHRPRFARGWRGQPDAVSGGR